MNISVPLPVDGHTHTHTKDGSNTRLERAVDSDTRLERAANNDDNNNNNNNDAIAVVWNPLRARRWYELTIRTQESPIERQQCALSTRASYTTTLTRATTLGPARHADRSSIEPGIQIGRRDLSRA